MLANKPLGFVNSFSLSLVLVKSKLPCWNVVQVLRFKVHRDHPDLKKKKAIVGKPPIFPSPASAVRCTRSQHQRIPFCEATEDLARRSAVLQGQVHRTRHGPQPGRERQAAPTPAEGEGEGRVDRATRQHSRVEVVAGRQRLSHWEHVRILEAWAAQQDN